MTKQHNFYGMGLIRLLLAISVIQAHTSSFLGYSIANGLVAVQVFYIFSGFYMFMILTEKYTSIKSFYKSRFLRIFPTYLIITIPLLIASLSFGKTYSENFSILNIYSQIFIIFTNIFIFFQDIVMFLAVNTDDGTLFFTKSFLKESFPLYKLLITPQAWTLGVELTFYILAPFIVKFKTKTIFFIIFASFFLRLCAGIYGLNHDPWTYRFFPFEIALFLLGGVSYRLYRKIRNIHLGRTPYFITSISILSIIFFNQLQNIIDSTAYRFIYYFLFSAALPFIFYASKCNINDRFIGDLSYPVYISHMAVIYLLSKTIPDYLHILFENKLSCLPAAFISIVVAIIINRYMQSKVDKIRSN